MIRITCQEHLQSRFMINCVHCPIFLTSHLLLCLCNVFICYIYSFCANGNVYYKILKKTNLLHRCKLVHRTGANCSPTHCDPSDAVLVIGALPLLTMASKSKTMAYAIAWHGIGIALLQCQMYKDNHFNFHIQ